MKTPVKAVKSIKPQHNRHKMLRIVWAALSFIMMGQFAVANTVKNHSDTGQSDTGQSDTGQSDTGQRDTGQLIKLGFIKCDLQGFSNGQLIPSYHYGLIQFFGAAQHLYHQPSNSYFCDPKHKTTRYGQPIVQIVTANGWWQKGLIQSGQAFAFSNYGEDKGLKLLLDYESRAEHEKLGQWSSPHIPINHKQAHKFHDQFGIVRGKIAAFDSTEQGHIMYFSAPPSKTDFAIIVPKTYSRKEKLIIGGLMNKEIEARGVITPPLHNNPALPHHRGPSMMILTPHSLRQL